MPAPLRLACGECLRSVDCDTREAAPSHCPSCGGSLRTGSVGTRATAERSTPLSLELSPEIATPWVEGTVSTGPLGSVGRFQLRELMGGGGFGQVYRAYDPRLDREVALKVLKQARPNARVMERFFREARAASQLDHPNIVALHDAGRDSGRCWIAYQFVAGPTLSRWRDDRPPSFEESARIVRDLSGALEHAHRRGVFHRDLKPANVLIDAEGRPRLTDFGLARRAAFEPSLTREGTILGTPNYMSPEQAAGNSHRADARSDVYSLGVILYELICGRRPAGLPSGTPIWRAAPTAAEPTPPRTCDPAIPKALDRICLRALAHDPSRRHPDARSLADDLDEWLSARARPPSGRARRLALAASIAVPAILALGAAFRPAREAAPPATPRPAGISGAGDVRAAGARPISGPPLAPPEAVASPADGAALVGSGGSKSKFYHRPTCASARQISARHRLEFADVAAARALGFSPCSRCDPPRD